MSDHRATVALEPEECLEAIAGAAELWGAEWHRLGTGGQLTLPVHAGVRYGTIAARLWTEPERQGTVIVLREEESHYHLKTGAVAVLALGGLSAIALTLWPLFPRLLALAPLALVFSFIAWLLIASRLHNSGIEEFLELVGSATGDGDEPASPGSETPNP